MVDFSSEFIVITSDVGLSGQHFQKERVKCYASQEKLLISIIEDYDLTKEGDVIWMYDDMNPTIVIHLTPEIGRMGRTGRIPDGSSKQTWLWAYALLNIRVSGA